MIVLALLTHNSEPDPVLPLHLVIHQAGILPGIFCPHCSQVQVKPLLVQNIPRVPLPGHSTPTGKLHKCFFSIFRALALAPPLNQKNIGIFSHIRACYGD